MLRAGKDEKTKVKARCNMTGFVGKQEELLRVAILRFGALKAKG